MKSSETSNQCVGYAICHRCGQKAIKVFILSTHNHRENSVALDALEGHKGKAQEKERSRL